MNDHLLYLSESDVAALGLDPDTLRAAVAAAFASKARGRAEASGKSVINIAPGHLFQAKPGVMRDAGYAGMKWFGLVPPGSTAGPSISSLIVLSDIPSFRDPALIMVDHLKEIWIDAELDVVDTPVYYNRVFKRDYAPGTLRERLGTRHPA